MVVKRKRDSYWYASMKQTKTNDRSRRLDFIQSIIDIESGEICLSLRINSQN